MKYKTIPAVKPREQLLLPQTAAIEVPFPAPTVARTGNGPTSNDFTAPVGRRTGVHEQMAQITSGLGLDGLVYTRDNPTGKSLHWLESPDGSRCLAISPGHYADWDTVFSKRTPLDPEGLAKVLAEILGRVPRTPAGAPVLVLAGYGDYSLPPFCEKYPGFFLSQWAKFAPQTRVRFTGLSPYVDAVLPGIRTSSISLPLARSGARLSWTSFWIDNPKVKGWFRRAEHELQAAEILATVASLGGRLDYPVQPLYHAWLQMLLNMDRNTLWGAAGGMVFEDEHSWDVRDRFESVEKLARGTAETALRNMTRQGRSVAVFNPLNWPRTDPIRLALPEAGAPAGVACQAEDAGEVLCQPRLASTGTVTFDLSSRPAPVPKSIPLPKVIETSYYRAKVDASTGALCSLKLRSSGREVLSGPVLLVAERAGDVHGTSRRDKRKRLADSGQVKGRISVSDDPLATVVKIDSSLLGGAARETLHFYKESPRIDFDVELSDVPDKTIVLAEFPLAESIQESRRGIPYGFSHGGWDRKDPSLPGFADGIVSAIRWSYYQFRQGGVAILDRGLPGRELTGRTPVLFLLNAHDIYMGYPSAWLSGRGRHNLSFALVAQDDDWEDARIPQMAWEFNSPPIVVAGAAKTSPKSFLQTSGNIIVQAIRREGSEIELRLAECLGVSGTAEVMLHLPHREAALTDLLGGHRQPLKRNPDYRFPVRPQQIVTLRFRTDSEVPDVKPLTNWEPLVPPAKRAALNTKLDKKGHPPPGRE